MAIGPGTVIADRYRIIRTIGRGGMAEVFEGTHVALGERVAIKVIQPKLLGAENLSERFIREAQICAKLKSEHAVRVSDVGALPDGSPYIVMELLEGASLESIVTAGLAPEIAVDYMIQAGAALAEAHALGIVHRDLKPANLFVTRRLDGEPLVKVLDFGISKLTDVRMTNSQVVFGTPAYMAPEHMRGAAHADLRSDIWSLGVVLFEVLEHGALPFPGESFAMICVKVTLEPPAPMQAQIAPGLTDAIAKCLAKDPAQRYQTVAELLADLAPYANDLAGASRIVDRAARLARRTTAKSPPLPATVEAAVERVRGAIKREAMTPLKREDK